MRLKFLINGTIDGVYKAGIATTQEAYEKAFDNLFQALDRLEVQLQDKDFLVGDQLTEADVRLYPTIVGLPNISFSFCALIVINRFALIPYISPSSNAIFATFEKGIPTSIGQWTYCIMSADSF